MGKMDDAVAELNAALKGSTDEVELAMGRVKGYLRHLKGGKVVRVKGHDRHFDPSVTDPKSPNYDANKAIALRRSTGVPGAGTASAEYRSMVSESKRIGAIAEEARGIRADLERTGLQNQDLADTLREIADATHRDAELTGDPYFRDLADELDELADELDDPELKALQEARRKRILDQMYMSNIDSAEDALIVALANVNVKSYTRRTKTGKSVRVSAYVRRMKGSDLSPGMEVKDSYGKPKTVKTAGPEGVTFTDGSKGGKSQVFTVTSGDPTQSRKSSGYDQARLQAAGNPGASGSKIPVVKSEGGKVAPMSDAEYEAHTKHIEEEIGKALSEGKATDKQFAVDANSGVWEFDRAQRHREIADAMWKARAEQVPNEGKAMISGGLGGAGKSTVLKIVPGADEKNYFTINSDDVKEHIAENFPDMIPEAGDLSPLERVALIHEESSHIADILAARAYAEKKNMIWDITMASQKSVQKRLDDLRANGYTDVKGVFVNIDVETSVERALARHRRGMEDFRNGKGQGGRYVPPHIIRLNKSDKSSSANLDTFTALKDQFDSWDQYNNNVNGRAPQKEGSSSDSGSGSAASSVAADPFVNRTNL